MAPGGGEDGQEGEGHDAQREEVEGTHAHFAALGRADWLGGENKTGEANAGGCDAR